MACKGEVIGKGNPKGSRRRAPGGGAPFIRRLPFPEHPPEVNVNNLSTFTMFPSHGHLCMKNPAFGPQNLDVPKYLFIRMNQAVSTIKQAELHNAAVAVEQCKVHRTTSNHGDDFHQVCS